MHGTRAPLQPRLIKGCRHGDFWIYDEDELVGLALSRYGEYSEGEVLAFSKVLRPGDVAIDVGANIGAFTVPMAKMVGPGGRVYAIEASAANARLLRCNRDENGLAGVIEVVEAAASDRVGSITVTNQDALHAYSRVDINAGSFEVDAVTVDSLELTKCKLIKIDVDRHELAVLRGARETIRRCKPVIYIENEHDDLRQALVAEIVDMGYRLYWHKPYQYNADNWRGEQRNLFCNIVSMMNLCVPDEEGYEVKALEEVSDYRDDDDIFEREYRRYARYVERDPDDLTSRLMAAHHAQLMQRHAEASALIEENLRRDPDHKPSLAIRGLWMLQAGRWREGWPFYELRFGQANRHMFGGDRQHPGARKWCGESTDETLLVWSEQGFGDNIMFARLMWHVLERAPNAYLEVRPELYELFEHSQIMPSGRLLRLGRTLPPYTLHCSVPSLPAALEADEKLLRAYGPYLFADQLLTDNWRGEGNVRLGQTPNPLQGATIGLCSRGSSMSERPYTRDIPESKLVKLSRKHGPFFPLEAKGQFDSFAMSAAAIKALDLVITVDTSVAHLAGALGVETWLLLSFDPDFRWGLSGNRTLWYPSMHIFRQPRLRDWDSVIEQVDAALSARTAQ